MKFQSTPPARGATQPAATQKLQVGISIHTPREGGDKCNSHTSYHYQRISIHTPREGGDALRILLLLCRK